MRACEPFAPICARSRRLDFERLLPFCCPDAARSSRGDSRASVIPRGAVSGRGQSAGRRDADVKHRVAQARARSPNRGASSLVRAPRRGATTLGHDPAHHTVPLAFWGGGTRNRPPRIHPRDADFSVDDPARVRRLRPHLCPRPDGSLPRPRRGRLRARLQPGRPTPRHPRRALLHPVRLGIGPHQRRGDADVSWRLDRRWLRDHNPDP